MTNPRDKQGLPRIELLSANNCHSEGDLCPRNLLFLWIAVPLTCRREARMKFRGVFVCGLMTACLFLAGMAAGLLSGGGKGGRGNAPGETVAGGRVWKIVGGQRESLSEGSVM